MRRGFLSLIAILISLLIFTILFIVVFNRLKIAQIPTGQSGKDPRVETQETIDKVIQQQNKEKIEFEQTDENDKKLLGVQTGKNYTALVYD